MSRLILLATSALLSLFVVPQLAMAANNAKLPYVYTFEGSPEQKPSIPQSPDFPSFVLMGGGPDVDEGFRFLIRKAGIKPATKSTPATGGRLVIIRATGDGAYNPYIYFSNAVGSTTVAPVDGWVGGASLGLGSVETLVIPDRVAADHPDVQTIVGRANAVWIAGGDQSDYIRFWKGSKLEATLLEHLNRKTPMGGTSAGLAVLGQFDFAALNGTVTSSQALGNPFNKYMTIDPTDANGALQETGGFLSPAALANTITDSHFDSRDRMGRLVTFMARMIEPHGTAGSPLGCAGGVLSNNEARGIGIGVETALLVEGNASRQYTARRVTNISTTTRSAVYFLSLTQGPTHCVFKQNLAVPQNSIQLRVLDNSSSTFNLSDWSGWPVQSTLGVLNGVLSPAAPY